MDASIHRSLNDKLYDKRKAGALEYVLYLPIREKGMEPSHQAFSNTPHLHSLENVIREASASRDHEKIKKIIHQLCHEYAYAVHAPYARNGGLIGLAAAAIALGPVRQGMMSYERGLKSLMMQIGSRSISRGDCAAGARLFHRSGCEGQILCV